LNSIDDTILEVLNDQKYRARTIGGVAKAIGVSEKVVIHRLKRSKKLNEHVKIYPMHSRKGEALITSREKFEKTATVKERFVDFFATRRAVIK
jgi:putative aminopeptidase FrvX